jgi:methylated-DNA-[protein]-cysteine S-methyltransferase
MSSLTVPTQFGPLTLLEEDGSIVRVEWDGTGVDETPLLCEAARQLGAYDAGALEVFDLPLRVAGSDFQRAVCSQMSAIPFGETVTYGDIAKALAQSPQAVGSACGGNPMPILIPCHRVMGAKGLTGFSGKGGVETKVALLRHERAGGFLI